MWGGDSFSYWNGNGSISGESETASLVKEPDTGSLFLLLLVSPSHSTMSTETNAKTDGRRERQTGDRYCIDYCLIEGKQTDPERHTHSNTHSTHTLVVMCTERKVIPQ